MTTWWKTTRYGAPKIEPVEVISSTAKQVVYLDTPFRRERKANKAGAYENYFETWEAAHAHLLAYAEDSVSSARRDLEVANSTLGNIKGMKKPEST